MNVLKKEIYLFFFAFISVIILLEMDIMDYSVHIENFDGPMDLLLHLVKETKLDIYEINMSSIIESYLNYIQNLQSLNIDVGSEFLLMASSLLHLKSKMLIGKTEEEDNDADEFNIQSEEDLKTKLVEYQKYKNITENLKELELKRSEIYEKGPENLKEYVNINEIINEDGLTVNDLVNALQNVLERLHYKEPVETKITKKELSVKERIVSIRSYLKTKKKCCFEDLFTVPTKDNVIITFLAILDMSKRKEIKLSQKHNFESIVVEALE